MIIYNQIEKTQEPMRKISALPFYFSSFSLLAFFSPSVSSPFSLFPLHFPPPTLPASSSSLFGQLSSRPVRLPHSLHAWHVLAVSVFILLRSPFIWRRALLTRGNRLCLLLGLTPIASACLDAGECQLAFALYPHLCSGLIVLERGFWEMPVVDSA